MRIMKKNLAILALLLVNSVAVFAQTTPMFPYQAVVRNASNRLVQDSTFTLTVEILQGAEVKYSETREATTDRNGMVSFYIGNPVGRTSFAGAIADVTDWSNASFRQTFALSSGDLVLTDPVAPVPYALQAANAGESSSTALSALANRVNTFNTNVCDSVANCDFSGNVSIQNMLQALSDLIEAQNDAIGAMNSKMDSLDRLADSISRLSFDAPFVCGSSQVYDHQGNIYNTVKIGGQCWTKENMRCTTSPSTNTVILEKPAADEAYAGKRAYYYDDDPAKAEGGYGLLYNWWGAVDTFDVASGELSLGSSEGVQVLPQFTGHRRGICPQGWHVPSNAEWTEMEKTVVAEHQPDLTPEPAFGTPLQYGGANTAIASMLATGNEWVTNSTMLNAPNDPDNPLFSVSGLSILPTGYRYGTSFAGLYTVGNFWSATASDSRASAYVHELASSHTGIFTTRAFCFSGYAVRCLRDGGDAGFIGDNETVGAIPSAPAPVNCDQVMECMRDTLGKLNAKIEAQNGIISTLQHTIDSISVVMPFVCGESRVRDYDGNTYATVAIGSQCWTRENLKSTHYSDGTAIPLASGNEASNTAFYRYYPANDSANVAVYGCLYNWPAVMKGAVVSEENPADVQGICPKGWHVPSGSEWSQLINSVNDQSQYQCNGEFYIAKALSAATGWENSEEECTVGNNTSSNNATGFSIVPAGNCLGQSYDFFERRAFFWTSSGGGNYARQFFFSYDSQSVLLNDNFVEIGSSVRCVRDE